jgi:acetolactate synthase-1/2/3 large subunit
VTPYLGIDNLPYSHPCNVGKPGIKGDRAANYSMQNADLILAIGTSLHVSVIGYNYQEFAREAKKVVVDIDLTSHQKKTISSDLIIQADARDFLLQFESALQAKKISKFQGWADRCRQWKAKYPVCLPEYAGTSPINIYSFIDTLSDLSREGDVFVADAGSAFYAISQGIKLKQGQRYIPSGAMATMGYSMPASIGVAVGLKQGRVFSITGDGSFQQNLQEMQTILEYKLPIKTFILNNGGYLSIRNSQKNYFNQRFIGEGPESGVTFPDSLKISQAYGMEAVRISKYDELKSTLKHVLDNPRAVLCDVICPREQPIIPTLSSRVNADGSMSSRPLEDMAPFLDREEYRSNLLVKEV